MWDVLCIIWCIVLCDFANKIFVSGWEQAIGITFLLICVDMLSTSIWLVLISVRLIDVCCFGSIFHMNSMFAIISEPEAELCPSWIKRFNRELVRTLSFSEHETFDHPVACETGHCSLLRFPLLGEYILPHSLIIVNRSFSCIVEGQRANQQICWSL
jgi:hypothetical protein